MLDVTVMQAQWNGKAFNVQPFSDNPPWLNEVLRGGWLSIIRTDLPYTIWGIMLKDGPAVAEPGDKIFMDPLFGLHLTKLPTNVATWEQYDPNRTTQAEEKPAPKKRVSRKPTVAEKPAEKKTAAKKKAAPRKKTATKKVTK